MTLGRTSSGAIKIKTDGGLRAVECACCNCQELEVRTLEPLIAGSITDLWNKEKLNHFWKTNFQVQGYITLPSDLPGGTIPFDLVCYKPICLYESSSTQVIYDDEVYGNWRLRVRCEYTASKLIDGDNVYYGCYQNTPNVSNSRNSSILLIHVNINTPNKTRYLYSHYVSAISTMPFFDYDPKLRSDILPVTPQVMLNPSKPELGDYRFHNYALVATQKRDVDWTYTYDVSDYPTVTIQSFTQI